MDIKELTLKNANALRSAIGAKLTCPMCKHNDFVVVGGYVRDDIQTQLNSYVFGSNSALNMAVVVCQHCGFVSHHLIDVLRKVETKGDADGSK